MITKYDLTRDQKTFGKLCALLTVVPSFLAALCFYRAGIYYGIIMKEKNYLKNLNYHCQCDHFV